MPPELAEPELRTLTSIVLRDYAERFQVETGVCIAGTTMRVMGTAFEARIYRPNTMPITDLLVSVWLPNHMVDAVYLVEQSPDPEKWALLMLFGPQHRPEQEGGHSLGDFVTLCSDGAMSAGRYLGPKT